MNRRNFVVGLGTVATISGVASVTAASFADNVTAGADFRVVVDEELTLEAGDSVEESEDEFLDEGEEINFTDVGFDDTEGVVIVFDDYDAEDGDIEIELAVANTEEFDHTFGDGDESHLLAVRNDGLSTQSIGIEYEYGDDVDEDTIGTADGGDTDGTFTGDEVADLFVFEADGTQVSPDTDEEPDEPSEFAEVDGGETQQLELQINFGDGEAPTTEEFANEADVSGDIFSGATDNFDLIEQITVGVQDD